MSTLLIYSIFHLKYYFKIWNNFPNVNSNQKNKGKNVKQGTNIPDTIYKTRTIKHTTHITITLLITL